MEISASNKTLATEKKGRRRKRTSLALISIRRSRPLLRFLAIFLLRELDSFGVPCFTVTCAVNDDLSVGFCRFLMGGNTHVSFPSFFLSCTMFLAINVIMYVVYRVVWCHWERQSDVRLTTHKNWISAVEIDFDDRLNNLDNYCIMYKYAGNIMWLISLYAKIYGKS